MLSEAILGTEINESVFSERIGVFFGFFFLPFYRQISMLTVYAKKLASQVYGSERCTREMSNIKHFVTLVFLPTSSWTSLCTQGKF